MGSDTSVHYKQHVTTRIWVGKGLPFVLLLLAEVFLLLLVRLILPFLRTSLLIQYPAIVAEWFDSGRLHHAISSFFTLTSFGLGLPTPWSVHIPGEYLCVLPLVVWFARPLWSFLVSSASVSTSGFWKRQGWRTVTPWNAREREITESEEEERENCPTRSHGCYAILTYAVDCLSKGKALLLWTTCGFAVFLVASILVRAHGVGQLDTAVENEKVAWRERGLIVLVCVGACCFSACCSIGETNIVERQRGRSFAEATMGVSVLLALRSIAVVIAECVVIFAFPHVLRADVLEKAARAALDSWSGGGPDWEGISLEELLLEDAESASIMLKRVLLLASSLSAVLAAAVCFANDARSNEKREHESWMVQQWREVEAAATLRERPRGSTCGYIATLVLAAFLALLAAPQWQQPTVDFGAAYFGWRGALMAQSLPVFMAAGQLLGVGIICMGQTIVPYRITMGVCVASSTPLLAMPAVWLAVAAWGPWGLTVELPAWVICAEVTTLAAVQQMLLLPLLVYACRAQWLQGWEASVFAVAVSSQQIGRVLGDWTAEVIYGTFRGSGVSAPAAAIGSFQAMYATVVFVSIGCLAVALPRSQALSLEEDEESTDMDEEIEQCEEEEVDGVDLDAECRQLLLERQQSGGCLQSEEPATDSSFMTRRLQPAEALYASLLASLGSAKRKKRRRKARWHTEFDDEELFLQPVDAANGCGYDWAEEAQSEISTAPSVSKVLVSVSDGYAPTTDWSPQDPCSTASSRRSSFSLLDHLGDLGGWLQSSTAQKRKQQEERVKLQDTASIDWCHSMLL